MKLFLRRILKFFLLLMLLINSVEILGMNRVSKLLLGATFVAGTTAISLILKSRIKNNFPEEQNENLEKQIVPYFEPLKHVSEGNGAGDENRYSLMEKGGIVAVGLILIKVAQWFAKETARIRKLNANTEKTKKEIKEIEKRTEEIKKETEEIEKKRKKKKKEGEEFKKRTDPIVKELDELNEKIKREIRNDPVRKMLFEYTADQMKKETKKRDRENVNGSSVKFEEWSDKDKEFKLL